MIKYIIKIYPDGRIIAGEVSNTSYTDKFKWYSISVIYDSVSHFKKKRMIITYPLHDSRNKTRIYVYNNIEEFKNDLRFYII